MTRFLYFAYGSNMLSERLAARCPSTEPVSPAEARGFSLSYCLGSTDGSAKAGLQADAGEATWGVLFSLQLDDLPVLDWFEGAPDIYARVEIDVFRKGAQTPDRAVTYLPQPAYPVSDMLPFAWYRALCIAGARQHGLPAATIARLAAGKDQPMPAADAEAHEGRQRALEALARAGMPFREAVEAAQ